MRLILIIALSVFSLALQAMDVVIIGGGPAGLATAIEAHSRGATVSIIEKRPEYSRGQLMMLFDHSLDLLKKWDVSIPTMRLANLDPDHRIGVTVIKDLEEALAKRVKSLGIPIIQGEFNSIKKGMVTLSDNVEIRYDILIGADGMHSTIRNALAIDCEVYGNATAIGAFIPLPNAEKEAEIPQAALQNGLFVKRLFLPQGRFVVVQYPLNNAEVANEPLDQQRLVTAAKTAGWVEEAEWIASGKSAVRPQIPIVLQQAKTFSDKEKSALLVGDAAAAAPFCQALGANTALKAAELAGELFASLNYSKFNAEMQEATDAMILDSVYLLNQLAN